MLSVNNDDRHRQESVKASEDFQKVTWHTGDRFYDYIESLSWEAKTKNIPLREVAEERAISILDLK